MKALILAAGLGSRLAPITDTVPKSLVPVNGQPILFRQIECLRSNGVEDITVVSGYLADTLEERVQEFYPDVKIVRNEDYKTTNNMYSALLGMRDFAAFDDINLMMNADVFIDESVISALLECPAENAVVVDLGRYLEESMKVVADSDGRLVHISKQIGPDEALGCSIDVYKFSNRGMQAFEKICCDYIEGQHELNMWSEIAIDGAFALERFEACPLDGRWLEIDNHDDLAAAEALFA
ncbi:MAG: phosphocholine cytidylyltransferase family protein [Eggerthellaceae bacterium]|nr:phosphocholine cytidylyltransferase family protein [Eggerthellaceae bacterium]